MSRIHEALKRAEEERAGRPAHAPEPRAEIEMESAAALETEASSAETLVEVPASDSPDIAIDELSREVLKTHVKQFDWNPHPKTMLFFGSDSYAPGTEEFRSLRSNLYSLREAKPLRTILVTSSTPKEGKSFISANLAQILVRQPDRRVLLIDADLRWSRLHLSFGSPSVPGLVEYLNGEADELAVMQRGPLENLYFIPGGKHPANPAELIANGRLKDLLSRVSPLFDWVIIDSPPALAVSDAKVMSNLCDGIIIVVGAASVGYPLVQKTHQQFKGKRLLGVVLNRAEPRMSYSYKYYGYYKGPEEEEGGKSKDRS